jgi:hypothetical protein
VDVCTEVTRAVADLMAIGTPADLAAARAKLVSNSSTGKPDETIMIEFLRLVRELGVSDPEGVCEYGSYVLAKCRGHLSAGECAFLNTYKYAITAKSAKASATLC